MMTRVSVAMATFNGARFIRQQVESVLAQTIPVDEVVVGDDGSSDSTIDILREYWAAAAPHAQLRILPGVGGLGVAGNFERVLVATTGDVVLLSDQDDVWASDRVERSLRYLADHPEVDLLFGDARLIDADGRPLESTLFEALPVRERERAQFAGTGAFSALLKRNLATGATMAVRRKALDSALPIGAGWLHDEWLALWLAITGRIALVAEPLIDYRQHGVNVIGVQIPTIRYRIRRLTQSRRDRNRVLASRMAVLQERLAGEPGVDQDLMARVRAKAHFERSRADLPSRRVARVVPVIRLAATGQYALYASQGSLDIIRDLVQRA